MLNETFPFAVKNRIPELWRADKGCIQMTRKWKEENDSTFVNLTLNPDESILVIFPAKK